MSAVRACVLILLASLAGCASVDLNAWRTIVTSPVAETPPAQFWRGLPVATGQIILNEHPDATALLFSLAAARFEPFVHAGVIVVDAGRPYVYESFGVYLPLPWTRPTAIMAGGVHRVTLDSFVARGGIIAIHEPPAGVDRAALERFARDSARRHVPFDAQFDPRDDSRFYCAEFVARALAAAGARRIAPVPVSRNPSMVVALDWFGITSPELELAGDLVTPGSRVVLLAQHVSEQQIEAYFALKRELHRRFTPDQKLGSLLSWRGQHLELRPVIEEYFERGTRPGVDPVLLADQVFGALPKAPRLAEIR